MSAETKTKPDILEVEPQSAAPAELARIKKAAITVEMGRGLIAADLDGLIRIAQMVETSGLAPASLKTTQAIVIAMAHGAAIGLPPLQALQSIAVVNGRPALYGDAPLALARASGQLVEFRETYEGDGDKLTAVCFAKRKDGQETTERFSLEDAKLAGLKDKSGPWKQYPRRMLRFRARAFALRDLFGDVLAGLAIREDIEDIEPEYVVKGTEADIPASIG